MSDETKEKIRKTLLGRKNPEHSKRMKGRKLTEEHKNKIIRKPSKIKVIQYTLDGEFIKSWGCVREAAKSIDLKNYYGIIKCCNGDIKSSKNYKWNYG